MDIIHQFPAYFVANLHSINYLYAGIVAVIFGLLPRGFLGVILLPVIAAVVYLAALIVVPALLHSSAIAMPVLDKALLEKLIASYVIFLVADTVVFAIKKLVAQLF